MFPVDGRDGLPTWLSRAVVEGLRRLLRERPLILCYHGVGDVPRCHDPHFLRVRTVQLQRQLELLAEAGASFMTVAELAAATRDGGPPAGAVAISFDDGYQDNLTIALPILQRMNASATVFVTSGWIGRPNPFLPACAGQRMLQESEILELRDAGIEIGAHTVNHPDLTQVPPRVCQAEVSDGKAQLEDLLGASVTSFAYPFFCFDATARAAVERAGFTSAVTGLAQGSFDDPFALPRALVGGKDGLPSFVLRAWDLYDPWFRSWPGRIVRGVSRPARRAVRGIVDRRRSSEEPPA